MRQWTMVLAMCALVLSVGAVLAQDEGEGTPATGGVTAKPPPRAPATGKPKPPANDPAAAAALEALMGEPEETRPAPAPDTTRDEPEEDAPRDAAAGRTSRDSGRDETPERTPDRRRQPEPLPSDAAVPEVPASVSEPARDTAADDTSDSTPFTAPYNDYRLPETTTRQPPEDPNALALDSAATTEPAPAKSGSPAMAIIIGLLALVVLLVALAAILGVMGAQRASAPRAAASVVDTTGWAYLAAPNAPNISLQKDHFVIGSDANCDLRLADPKASPHHARIDNTDDGYVLTDLHSTNGTLLNGERIGSPVTLRPGDEIHMGDIIVTFEIQQ